MGYKIHFLGDKVETVPTREDALWHLGAKFGGLLYNKAFKLNLIRFDEDYVLVKIHEINKLN